MNVFNFQLFAVLVWCCHSCLVTRIVHLFKCWSMNWHCLLAKQNNLVIQNENENGNMIFVMWMFVARLNYRHTSLLSSLLIVCVLRILRKIAFVPHGFCVFRAASSKIQRSKCANSLEAHEQFFLNVFKKLHDDVNDGRNESCFFLQLFIA